MTDANKAGGGTAASDADLDMFGVDPLRYAEMRRRVAVIREFLATERTPKAVREAFAARLGVGEKQFMRLVATWRALGDEARAAALDGATGGKGGRRKRRGGLGADARTVVADAVADLGSDAPLSLIWAEVRRLASERDVRPLSRSSVWNLLMDARSQGAPSRQEPGTVTGAVIAKLPVASGVGTIHPVVTLTVRSPDGVILAHQVEAESDAGSKISSPQRPAGSSETGEGEAGDGASRLVALLGRRISSIGIIHHRALAAPAATLLRSRRDAPISADDAKRLIARAIEEHNRTRCGGLTDE